MIPDTSDSPSPDLSLPDFRQRYGLSSDPFREDPEFTFFSGARRGQLLEKLQHQCQFSASLLAVLGEPGTGKTRMARALANSFGPDDEICSLGARPGCTAEDILTGIADSFSLLSDTQASVGQLLASLRRFGQSADELDSLALVVVDDAQHLNEQTLGAMLTLLQGQDSGGRRLHIVLFAEPQLANRLDQFHMHEVLIHDFYLEPFSLAEAADYLNFRMEMSGYLGPELFNELLVEPWWHRADGRLPFLHQAAHQWLLESVVPDQKRRRSRLPLVHIVAIAVLLGVLFMAFLYSGGDEMAEGEEGTDSVVSLAEEPVPVAVSVGSRAEGNDVTAPEADDGADRAPRVPTGAPENIQTDILTSPVRQPEPSPATESEPAPPSQSPVEEPESTPVAQPSEPEPAPVVNIPEDEQVLLSWRPGDYTLQLLGASSEQSVRDFIADQPNRNQLLQFKTRRQDKDWYVVVAGRYSSAEQARAAIADLPSRQREAGPWPRSLKEIQEEIERERGL